MFGGFRQEEGGNNSEKDMNYDDGTRGNFFYKFRLAYGMTLHLPDIFEIFMYEDPYWSHGANHWIGKKEMWHQCNAVSINIYGALTQFDRFMLYEVANNHNAYAKSTMNLIVTK